MIKVIQTPMTNWADRQLRDGSLRSGMIIAKLVAERRAERGVREVVEELVSCRPAMVRP
jgi:hypothetical protein